MAHFNWSPGIGDPTVAGWLTVILYFVTSVSCWILARELRSADIERCAWRSISILFFFLGINKQLNLQTALTEAGRYLAYYQGWYGQRQLVQRIHSSDCGDMPYLCNHTADLGEACPDIHLVRSDRNDAGYWLCIDPRGVVPPHRSLHWPYNSWFPLELDFGNGRDFFGAFRESVAADSPCRMNARSLSSRAMRATATIAPASIRNSAEYLCC